MTVYWVLVLWLPAVFVLLRPKAVVNILVTAVATWLASSFVLCTFELEDNIELILLFIFVLLPLVTVGAAMTFATTLARKRPRMWFDAGFLAMIGWWLGLAVLIFALPGGLFGTEPSQFWSCAQFMAAPALYAGAGAGFGATNKPISSTSV